MYFTSGSDRAFERLMQGKPGFDHYDSGEAGAPEDCGDCRFYRPGWKYQFCVYAECPYQPGKLTACDAVLFQVKGVDDEMAVFRVEKNRGYTVMSNHHLRNKDLSLKAKGLLSQMLSLPEDWDYTLKGLSLINRESIDAIRTAVWELEKAGYITRQQNRDGRGKMADMVYTIYEQPQPRPEAAQGEQPGLENPVLENPTSDNPTSENPVSGNPMQINKDIPSKEGFAKIKVLELMLFLSVFDTQVTQAGHRGLPPAQVHLAKSVATYQLQHMGERYTLNQVATIFGVSRTCIKNSFKAVYGVSFYSFIKAGKMESAAYMLEHTDKPIVEIAGEHGYENSSKFANAFRSVKGISPGAYRQQNQKTYEAGKTRAHAYAVFG